ncbi:MAG: undecaprenyl-phosphate glucose phosphotransferase [Caldithrix sp.]|nr:MAG: undecaprenyl-phosphate glucose phosphotransferase [Caldithrix sp.]
MQRRVQIFLTLAADFISLNSAFFLWAWLRREMGFFAESDLISLLQLSLIINLAWILFFAFYGLYGLWHAKSRVDEFIRVFKTLSLGVLILFLLTFESESDLSTPPKMSRMFIVNYWLILLVTVPPMRVLLRTVQRALLSAGIGHRRTLIVGWGKKSWHLSDEIGRFPALGHNVIGFVAETSEPVRDAAYKNIPLLGSIDRIDAIVQKVKAQEVILAMQGNTRQKVMEVIDQCNGCQVNFKIVPDLYDIVIGQARTNQIYGFPLIDVQPRIMPPWEQRVKRLMDVMISAFVIIAFAPLWLLVAIAIKLDSKGTVFYKQNRVGKDGKEFMVYKFRSMVQDAESQTGPMWAEKKDPRLTMVGKLLRRPRIDEVPQLINVLKGEMSLIGPRPERPYFVNKFKRDIPFYTRRLKVKPGITGWAQIKGGYDTSIENVRTKLQYDLFYIENMSLRMDLKVILNTIYVMLSGKGQ